MLCRHVFGKISSEFRGISQIYLKFAAPRPREISEARPGDTNFINLYIHGLVEGDEVANFSQTKFRSLSFHKKVHMTVRTNVDIYSNQK